MRIGGELIEIPWPDAVLRQYQSFSSKQQIQDHINVQVLLGFVPGRRP